MSNLYIITGANGHLGNSISRLLLNQNHYVRGLILPNDSDKMLKKLGVDVFFGDVRKQETLEPLFDVTSFDKPFKQLIVIHAAGIVSITAKKSPLLEDVNINGTKMMADLALKHRVDKFIYVSSVHAIPEKENSQIIHEIEEFDPELVHGAYAKTKAAATKYVLSKVKDGLNAIVVHPSGIIGPFDYGKAHMTMMFEDYLNGFLTSRINGAYDFVDVRDVSSGITQASISGKIGSCYILSGHRTTLKDLFDHLRIISGKKLKINVLPMWFAKFTAPLAELYYKMRKLPPIYTAYSLYTLKSNSFFSYQRAHTDLNYTPRSFDETIYDTVNWLVDEKRIKRQRVIHFIKRLKPKKSI
ncbi:MAG: dihydroflavonol 4-reductase [Tenericutes bacterium HGW-Tenericutes-3]|nr:MAG: dihydroflavonol 4-reductase [Tenericutes bacterium HGW-Tenericutes-3]